MNILKSVIAFLSACHPLVAALVLYGMVGVVFALVFAGCHLLYIASVLFLAGIIPIKRLA